MVVCSRPECQTTAGCQCNKPNGLHPLAYGLSNLPLPQLPVRTPLSEYSDAEIRHEFYMRAQRWLGDQRIGVDCLLSAGGFR